ncbi:MAG: hypothetical protein ACJAZ2_000089 [Glaciecola sp.]|jgi:hypothetical protein
MKKALISVLILWCTQAYGQQVHSVLNHEINSVVEKNLYRLESNFHTSIRPFYHHEVEPESKRDSLVGLQQRDNRIYLTSDVWWAKFLRWTENKLLDEDLIDTQLGTLKLRINPTLAMSKGQDRITQFDTWQNSRGFQIEGEVGEKFAFNSSFRETQALFLPFISDYGNRTFVLPGQGRWKHFKGGPALDVGSAAGVLLYKANKTFTFQFGHGKNFLGDGYRSLLLSDNAINYPFLKIETTFWNIKYVNLIAQFNHMGFVSAGDRLFDKKWMAAQYLSWNVTKRLNISLYEAVSWRALPTRNFDVNYLNPVAFLRPIEFQNGSKDAVILGLTSKFKIKNNVSIYGQLIIDDLQIAEFKNGTNWWGNKYGIQAGIKAFDLFTLKGLSFQAEYNMARPYTYSHSDSITAYTQLNEALAHPLGANFKEGLAFLRYNHKRHFIEFKISEAGFGADTANINHGNNIFLSYNTNKLKVDGPDGEFGHKTLQGLKTTLTILEAKYAYMLNPRSNLMLEIGIRDRMYSNSLFQNKTRYVYIGVRTSLSNFYYDFL